MWNRALSNLKCWYERTLILRKMLHLWNTKLYSLGNFLVVPSVLLKIYCQSKTMYLDKIHNPGNYLKYAHCMFFTTILGPFILSSSVFILSVLAWKCHFLREWSKSQDGWESMPWSSVTKTKGFCTTVQLRL